MRAILIDPEKRHFTEIKVKGDGDIDEIYKLLHCNRFDRERDSAAPSRQADSICDLQGEDYLEGQRRPTFLVQGSTTIVFETLMSASLGLV